MGDIQFIILIVVLIWIGFNTSKVDGENFGEEGHGWLTLLIVIIYIALAIAFCLGLFWLIDTVFN